MTRRHLSCVLVVLLVLLCASSALAKPRRKHRKAKAQTSAELNARKEREREEAQAAQAQAKHNADAKLEEAKRRFEEAVQLVEEGNHEAAIVEFEASYALVPRPNTLYNLGLVHEKLFRYDEALGYYEKYLRLAPEDDPDRTLVFSAMKRLRGLLGTLRIASKPASAVWLDGRHIGQSPGEFTIPAGRHIVELRRDGFLPAKREVHLVARRETELSVTLKNAKDKPPLSPAFFWTGVGLTVVSAGIGTYFGIRTLSLNSEAEALDPTTAEGNAALREKNDEIQSSALLADIFFVSAGVLGVGTIVSAFFTDWEGDDDETDASTSNTSEARKSFLSQIRFTPWVSPNAAGLTLGGKL